MLSVELLLSVAPTEVGEEKRQEDVCNDTEKYQQVVAPNERYRKESRTLVASLRLVAERRVDADVVVRIVDEVGQLVRATVARQWPAARDRLAAALARLDDVFADVVARRNDPVDGNGRRRAVTVDDRDGERLVSGGRRIVDPTSFVRHRRRQQ